MDQLLQYWAQLRPRERQLLMGAGGILVLMLLYLLLWEPLVSGADRLQQQVKDNRELVEWMRQSANEVRALQASRGRQGSIGGQSLLGVIDRTAKGSELGSAVKRIEPDGQERVRVWLERASFDDMVVWLDQIQRQFGLQIESAVIDRDVSEGRVSARVVIEGGNG